MNLTSALNEWSARPELATFHNDFIELTESVLSARLHERHLESFSTYGVVLGPYGLGTIVLATNTLDVLGMRMDGKDIEFRPREDVFEAQKRGGKVLACLSGRQIDLSVTTGQAEIQQKTRIPTVIGGGTNFVFTNFPNAYLFGCLVELFDHLRDGEQTAHYKTRFEEAVALANSTMVNRSPQQFARARSVR